MKIFHHTDNDGYLSAAIVKRKYPNGIFIPYNYSSQFPLDLINPQEEIIIVDLSFKTKSQLEEILQITPNLIWIDHHLTSKKIDSEKIKGIRVEERPAACVLCWEYFFQDEPVPEIIQIVNDYDTWAHIFGEKTRFFNTAMSLLDTPDAWLSALNKATPDFINKKIEQGKLIEQYLDSYYKRLSKEVIFTTIFQGHKTAVCNAYKPSAFVFKYWEESDLKATFFYDGRIFHISLYSEKINCAQIAEQFGGGGHKSAAGFRSTTLPFIFQD